MSDNVNIINSEKTSIGIEFGSTRIKAVLIDDKANPLASGSFDWENSYKSGIWTYSLDEVKEGLQTAFAKLKADVEHRNEVINIVKADKTESSQEFKNALGASLKTFFTDFTELKAMPMSEDVGYGMSETLDNVFRILEKNGITIK